MVNERGFIMLEINSYKKINDDSIGTVRQLFNEASKKQLNLIYCPKIEYPENY